MAVSGHKTLFLSCRDEYVRWQLAFVVWSGTSCLFNHASIDAWAPIIQYFVAFVATYVVIASLLRQGHMYLVAAYITLFAALATIPGIYEGIFHSPLTIYDKWDQLYKRSMGYDLFDSGGRVSGTLGNPIIYSTALLLALPWVAENATALRWPLFALIACVAALPVARTWFLVATPVAIGVIVSRRRARGWALLAALVIVPLAVKGFASAAPEHYATWMDRLSGKDNAATDNLRLRADAVAAVLVWSAHASLWDLGMGHGTKSASSFAEHSIGFPTVDNAYATIIYETGIVGVLFYLGAWLRLLLRIRGVRANAMHVCGIVGLLLIGVSFVSYAYATTNLSVVASAAYVTVVGSNASSAARRRLARRA